VAEWPRLLDQKDAIGDNSAGTANIHKVSPTSRVPLLFTRPECLDPVTSFPEAVIAGTTAAEEAKKRLG